jgi:hypothetical protein
MTAPQYICIGAACICPSQIGTFIQCSEHIAGPVGDELVRGRVETQGVAFMAGLSKRKSFAPGLAVSQRTLFDTYLAVLIAFLLELIYTIHS